MSVLRGSLVPIPEAAAPPTDSLTERFDPAHLKVSGMFTAILARLLGGFRWTDTVIAEVILLADGPVMARNEGDIGANQFFADLSDLKQNLRGVVDTVGVTREERIRLAFLFSANVTNHGADFDPFEFLGLGVNSEEARLVVLRMTTSHDLRLLNRRVNYGRDLGVMYASAFIEWAVENGWEFSRRRVKRGTRNPQDGWTAWNTNRNHGFAINPAMFRYAMALGGIERE